MYINKEMSTGATIIIRELSSNQEKPNSKHLLVKLEMDIIVDNDQELKEDLIKLTDKFSV